jgi:hypothetical protein
MRDTVFALFSLAVVGATTLTLVSMAPRTQGRDIERSAPAWPPNAAGHAVG